MCTSSLDLSFNNIRHLPSLSSLIAVKILYFVQNKITKIDQGVLDWCADTLTSLELGGNRIRVSERRRHEEVELLRAWPRRVGRGAMRLSDPQGRGGSRPCCSHEQWPAGTGRHRHHQHRCGGPHQRRTTLLTATHS